MSVQIWRNVRNAAVALWLVSLAAPARAQSVLQDAPGASRGDIVQTHAHPVADSGLLSDWQRVLQLKPSMRVRIDLQDGTAVTGRINATFATRLTISASDRYLFIDRGDVRRVTMIRSNGGKYAKRGGLIGVVLAVLSAVPVSAEPVFVVSQIVSDGGLGALIGACIGRGQLVETVIYEVPRS